MKKEKAVWTHIKPSETKGSHLVRQKGPSWIYYLALIFMTLSCLVLFFGLDINLHMITWLFIFGSWSAIAASETDVNSPLNQTLMDKIRGNLDYLFSVGSQVINLNGSDSVAAAGTTLTITLDSSVNWLDRNIIVRGIVAGTASAASTAAALADAEKILPGGSEDDQVFYDSKNGADGDPNFTVTEFEHDFPDGFFYSGVGGAAYNTAPYLSYPGVDGNAWVLGFYVWVHTGGDLRLTTVYQSTPRRAAAYNLMIMYSEDQGGV